MSLPAGQIVLEHYVIEQLLDETATTETYSAHHQWLHHAVAIKLHVDPSAAKDLARFNRSAEVMARIRSPHVVSLLAHGFVEGMPCTATELPQGATLRTQLGQVEAIQWTQAIEVIRLVLMGLRDIHHAGVLHRNLQPESIMLVPGDQAFVKLVDLSLAKPLFREGRGGITTAGRSIGTLTYMSPEQMLARPLDVRSDLYSAALVLYELLTGSLPESELSIANLGRRTMQAPPPPLPPPGREALPPPLADLVVKTLDPERDKRPRSAQRFAQELLRVKNEHAPAGDTRKKQQQLRSLMHGLTVQRPRSQGRVLRLVRSSIPDGTAHRVSLRTSDEEATPEDGVTTQRIRGLLVARLPGGELDRTEMRDWLARLMDGRGRCGQVAESFWVGTFTSDSDEQSEQDMRFVKSCLVEHFWEGIRVGTRLVDASFELSPASLDGSAAPPREMLELLEAVAR